MRHLGTLIAALVIAPTAWILLAIGQDRSARAFAAAQDAPIAPGELVRPALLLAAAGLLLGLIGTLRFSPLGAVLAGAGYAVSYLGLLVSPARTLGLFDHTVTVAGRSIDLAVPLKSGTALLLGAFLLVAAVSLQRWRRWPGPAGAVATETPDRADPELERPLGADGLGLGPAEREWRFGDDQGPDDERDTAAAGGGAGAGAREPEPALTGGRYDALFERRDGGRHATPAGRHDAATERFDGGAGRYEASASRFDGGVDRPTAASPARNDSQWQRGPEAHRRAR